MEDDTSTAPSAAAISSDRAGEAVPARGLCSLRTTLVWYVALPATLWIVLVSWLASQALHQEWGRSLEEDVELVGRAIRAPLARALETGQLHQVADTLISTQDIGRIYGVSVYGDAGQLIATVGDIDPDEVVEDLHDVAKEGRHGGYERLGGRRVYSYFLPLSDSGGRVIGLLQITRRQREMDEALLTRRLHSLLLALGGAVGLAILALWGYHRALRRHLNRLGRDIAEVRTGERSHRAAVSGPAEIATLAEALNEMLDGMAAAEQDIARRQQQESQLKEQLVRSEQLAALGQFSAGVAHELGTPLSTIDGYAQRLGRDSQLSSQHGDTIACIRQEVQRTGNIVRQLLEVGRTRSRSWQDSNPLRPARAALAALMPQLEQRAQRCRSDFPDNNHRLAMDPGRVEQALGNLLLNASQASPDGAELEISCVCTQTQAVYRVSDRGPGVDDHLRQHMCKPFFTTKSAGQGTGLGLAVVHSVAEEHGGSITVENRPDGGAVFTLTITCHRSPAASAGDHVP